MPDTDVTGAPLRPLPDGEWCPAGTHECEAGRARVGRARPHGPRHGGVALVNVLVGDLLVAVRRRIPEAAPRRRGWFRR